MAATALPPRSERRRRFRRRYGSLLITIIAIGAILVANEIAKNKFVWWKDAQFAGRVVAREARVRETGAIADPDAAAKKPKGYRFFLRIDTLDGVQVHEVTLRIFQSVQPGWMIAKLTGTYECTLTPPS